MRGPAFEELLQAVVATQVELDTLAQSVHERKDAAQRAELRARTVERENEALRGELAERDATIEQFTAMVEDLEQWEASKQDERDGAEALEFAECAKLAAESENAELRAVVRHCKRKMTALSATVEELSSVLAELRSRQSGSAGGGARGSSDAAESDVAFAHTEALLRRDCEIAALRKRLATSKAMRTSRLPPSPPAATSAADATATEASASPSSVQERLYTLESMLRAAELKITELTRTRKTTSALLRVAERRATNAVAERDEAVAELAHAREQHTAR